MNYFLLAFKMIDKRYTLYHIHDHSKLHRNTTNSYKTHSNCDLNHFQILFGNIAQHENNEIEFLSKTKKKFCSGTQNTKQNLKSHSISI